MRIVQIERELQCLAEVEGPFAPKTVVTNAHTLAALASHGAAQAAAGALTTAGLGKVSEAEVAAAAAAAFAADYGVEIGGDTARAAGGGGGGSSSSSSSSGKKKKKKSVAAPSAPSRLCPGGADTVLRFLHPEKPEVRPSHLPPLAARPRPPQPQPQPQPWPQPQPHPRP